MPDSFLLQFLPDQPTDVGRVLIVSTAAIFGATVGSFLNVCIWRIPRAGLGVGKPTRSFCPLCGAAISWADNVPILSWVLLRGRCRSCRAPISMRYPVVEALTAMLFAVVADRFLFEIGGSPLGVIVLLAILCALIVAAFIDFDLRILPDEITIGGMHVLPLVMLLLPELRIGPVGDSVHRLLAAWAGASSGFSAALPSPLVVGLVVAVLGGGAFFAGCATYRVYRRWRWPEGPRRWRDLSLAGVLSAFSVGLLSAIVLRPDWAHTPAVVSLTACLLGMLCGSALIWIVGVVATRIFRKPAMGFGDVKLMGLLGGLTGWVGVLVGFLGACMLGSVWGIGRLIVCRDRYLPFGPFLAISCWILYLWPGFFPALVDWYLGLVAPAGF